MSDPLHIIVSLSPETIEALAKALRRPDAMPPEPSGEPLFTYRKPYARETTPVMGADVERVQDRAAQTRVGIALQRLGYRVAARPEHGTRERVYRRTEPC